MTETKTYRRAPAIRCWIKHIIEGTFSMENKILYTIFGEVKRARIVATILKKSEKMMAQQSGEGNFIDDGEESNIRVDFDLDDGTGVIRATIWRVDPEDYQKYKEGDIIDVIGLIRHWNGYNSISPEIINIIDEPNFILLRNAEIIKKLKSGNLHEIPEKMDSMGVVDEIDIDDLFVEENSQESNSVKEKIYSLIENNKDGISFKELKQSLTISDEDLKSNIRDLEMESRIYQSEENIYQTY